jgi:hypothetical protein
VFESCGIVNIKERYSSASAARTRFKCVLLRHVNVSERGRSPISSQARADSGFLVNVLRFMRGQYATQRLCVLVMVRKAIIHFKPAELCCERGVSTAT